METDLNHSVMDEICLEGLCGITLDSLWLRLEIRFSSFENSFDFKSESVQKFIFENIIKRQTEEQTFQMFVLPEKRNTLEIYNRFDFVNEETGTFIEDSDKIPIDIYGEVIPVKDGDIRGSSHDYFDRMDVSDKVLSNNMSISDITREFGLEKLVIVANQFERNKTLFGTLCDPFLELTPIQFCIIERIGRQRFLGEITVGKECGNYNSTPKTLFYYRKVLLKHQLIKKKRCIVYNTRSNQNNHGLIFYLNRFFVQTFSPSELNAKQMSLLLLESPTYELDYEEVRNKLNIKQKKFRELLNTYSENFKVNDKNNAVAERSIQLIRAIREEETNDGIDEPEDCDDDEDFDDMETNKTQTIAKNYLIYKPGNILVDRPLITQTLALIESHDSEEGISLLEIGRKLSLPKLESRSLIRSLEKLGDITSRMVDRGRQKVTLFAPKCRSDQAINVLNNVRKSLSVNESDTVGRLKRANLILEYVKKAKLVDRIFTLKKLIRDSESDLLHKVDTKSIVTLVHKLAADGHVRSIRTILRFQDQVKKLHFVCIPNITPDNPLVKEKINQIKFQWIGKQCFDVHSGRESSLTHEEKSLNAKTIKETKHNPVINLIYQPSVARKYGLEPKLKKLLTLYRYLFYLTHDFRKENLTDTDWRFNIYPLPEGQKEVCTIGDIIPRMPLCIFVRIVWISFVIPGLQELIDDPIAINLTLSQISPAIRHCLLYKRKFAFNICESLMSLSYLGLVETEHKEQLPKETTVIIVKNTTSLVNNNSFFDYEFKTLEDFEKFAEDLQYHCFQPCDASNCSLDQRLFPHNLRNWTYTPSYKAKNALTNNRLEKVNLRKSESIDDNENPGKRKRNSDCNKVSKKLCLSGVNDKNKSVKENSKSTIHNSNKDNKNSKSRTVKSKVKRIRSRPYDSIDLKARHLLKKKRTDWTQEEDSFLLVCKVVSALLDPDCPNYICVGKNVIRDQLHTYSPHVSKDKTALACQRRINYMLKNPNTRQNLSDCIGEFNQELRDLISKPKVPKTHENVWNEEFVKLLNIILKRMQSPYVNDGNNSINNFDSFEDLLSKYNVVKSSTNILPVRAPMHENPNNVVDIHVNVVTNVLLSSLLSKHYLNSNAKESAKYFAQTLFKIYQRYPDSLIRSVVAKLNKYGIMTKLKKKIDLNSLKARGSNTPYRISQNFLFLLQTKYFLENLLIVDELNDDYICIKEGKTGFEAAIVTSLLTSKSVNFETNIPENIVLLDNNFPLTTTVRNSVKNPFDPKCSSRYALHVLRQHIHSLPSDRTQHSQDYLFINQCKVNCNAIKPFSFNKSDFEKVFDKQKSFINPEFKPTNNRLTTNDRLLLNYIKSKKELGASVDDIKIHNNGIWPKDSLLLFQNLNFVYRVGVRSFRWVFVEYLNPWLVHSPINNSPKTKFIKFIPRYWKRPDGSIDDKVLFKFLTGILGHIMTYPCITQQKLIDYFNQSLQPIQLLEIIELLKASNCLDIIESNPIPKPSIFKTKTIKSSDIVIHYITTDDCLIRLNNLKTYLLSHKT